MQTINQGPIFEFLFVVLTFLVKKNIRFNAWETKEGQMTEYSLLYEMSPEQNHIKLMVIKEASDHYIQRGTVGRQKYSSKVALICNQFEYEIIYKKFYTHFRFGLDEESKDEGPPPGLQRLNNTTQMMPGLPQMPQGTNPLMMLQ